MKQIFLLINVKPKSINNKMIPIRMGRSLRLAKAPEYRDYERTLTNEFAKSKDVLSAFGKLFDEKNHSIQATWRVYVPENEYFTKRGTISKTCIDATNTIKIMEDILVKFMGVDDSQIVESTVRKAPYWKTTWCVSLELRIEPKPEVIRQDSEKYFQDALLDFCH